MKYCHDVNCPNPECVIARKDEHIAALEAWIRSRGHGYNCDLKIPCDCGYDALMKPATAETEGDVANGHQQTAEGCDHYDARPVSTAALTCMFCPDCGTNFDVRTTVADDLPAKIEVDHG